MVSLKSISLHYIYNEWTSVRVNEKTKKNEKIKNKKINTYWSGLMLLAEFYIMLEAASN